jgi:CheY-like chemotaxis protein
MTNRRCVSTVMITLSLNPQVTKKMDGMEALAYLERSETTPDLILLDVMMPGLSGYEVGTRTQFKDCEML